MSSRVQCVISQIAGLLQDHQARLKNPKASQLTLEPYSRILPQRISAARQQCAMVSKENMASALDFDPGNSWYWSKRHRDIVFGAIKTMHLPPSLQVSQSATQCMMTQSKMLKCVQHSLRSAMCSELPTATFLYLSNWDSNHTWNMDIIAVWNKEAKHCLTDGSPNWQQTLQRGNPEAVWEKNQYLAREDTDHITNHVCPQYFKLKREDVTGQERGPNANVHLQPWDDKQFDIKCPNWKVWAYTDGSCIGRTL